MEKEIGFFGKETANKDGLRSICKSCNSARALKWHSANVERVNARERAFYAKDPSKSSEKNKKWRKENPEKVTASNRKRWKNRDIEKTKEKDNAWRKSNPDKASVNSKRDYEKNKEKRKPVRRKWEQANKGKRRAIVAKRRAAKLQATPKWLTKEQLLDIQTIYIEADRLSRETGVPREVDHVVPLQGKNVCGLHVSWNLEILTKEENARKHNKFSF
jgi:hypothetical protein